ncbi:DUF5829 family protein [Pendulispora rubella]|uniref:DUF5829 family protein n=1 Tax=Pendulispora rubella TaxID=2741070 RepID=A0ABZ2L7Q5_9BACT
MFSLSRNGLALGFVSSLGLVAAACASRAPSLARPPVSATSAPAVAASKVRLNHVLGQFDEETATAIAKNPFVTETFAGTMLSTTEADGRSWTGFYVTGRETYVEIFGPQPKSRTGESGIGLGVDKIGELDALANKVRSPSIPIPVRTLKINDSDGSEIPWFKAATVIPEGNGTWLECWVMEYLPEFMSWKFAAVRSGPEDITRATFNAKKYRPERLLRDVRGAHFFAPSHERDKFAESLAAFGWVAVRNGEDAIATSDGVELRVTADPVRRGLVELRFALTRPTHHESMALGHSTLEVGPDATAVWRFAPAQQ